MSYSTGKEAYTDPGLFVGHTCGYPYLLNWQASHKLVCVPIFDVDGCQGNQYCSWFITHPGYKGASVEDFRNRVVALNGHNSNSGMNVLRYEISKMNPGDAFFSRAIISGGHAASVELISQQKADLAAIDAVTFAHLKKGGLLDPGKIILIGQSEFTTGLPFIMPRIMSGVMSRFPIFQTDETSITAAMNNALVAIDQRHRQQLGIRSFEIVTHSDYDKIGELKTTAENLGYPVLI